MLTYNRENFVSRAIESVLKQTFPDFEFIIINNGSIDRSGEIAEEYSAGDSRIRVLHRERGNIGSGRNAGLDAARGDYIAFIDDDDWCEPDFLELLYNLAKENNADVSICGGKVEGKDFQEYGKIVMNAEEALLELMKRKKYNMAFPTKMFTRELSKKIRFPEHGMYDDISQMHRMLAIANKIAYHGLPKYTFYRHETNNSAWTTNHSLLNAKTLNEYLRTYRDRTEWLSSMFPNSTAAWRYFEWSFMISMVEKINKLEIKDCERQLDSMLHELRENKDEFLQSGFIQEFEKKWMEIYVH